MDANPQPNKTEFYFLPEKVNFSKEEERILAYWTQIDAFKQQLKKSEGKKEYTFYDGPPFATGTPHYGHILAGTIKDVVTRYATQTGHHVTRRFGWDCHGLPVEYEIDKQLKINGKKDYDTIGIAEYNKKCREIVMRYSEEWRQIITRFGRWIDFDDNYKTMNLTFMESVWWVFKQIFEKGLVYRGCRVMPYSTACSTVLSNFEANQNYKDAIDPSIYVTFPLVKDPNVKFVAWTTTPWTLPANVALTVNPEFVYLKYQDKETSEVYIAAECRMGELYSKVKDGYIIIEKMTGKQLEGTEYIPLFDYYQERRADGCFRVLCSDFVTNDTGTGIVHTAPAFGADDYKVAVQYKIIRPDDPPCPVDDNGRFTAKVKDYEGQYIKDADKQIKKDLKQKKRLIYESTIKHSYPFCWRSETPLIYKAHHCWFIKVTDIKQDLLKNNLKSKWVPKFAQEKRFHNWLENAEDWCFSRNRLWGNPIPIWVSDDYEEVVCIGSIKELEELTGVKGITDLHREFIDKLTIPSKKGKGNLKRIEELFDCWFESGSMPYGQCHYPFSTTEEQFKERFPADFIGEGIDQTRGWFYTMNVISTALRNENPFKNLVVNGIVLAENGKKMSKKEKNYPDPKFIVEEFGADAVRLYLINSPLVRAEKLCFSENGVKQVVKSTFLPWYNAYRFLIQNIERWELDNKQKFWYNEEFVLNKGNLTNYMDVWVIAACQNLIKLVREEMGRYKLYKVVPKLVIFLENLTNWYVRLNRNRLKGDVDSFNQLMSLNCLFDVVLKSAILMGCVVPFIVELIYDNLRKCIPTNSKYYQESIHFLEIPQPNLEFLNEDTENSIKYMHQIIDMGRILREQKLISLKQPITSVSILSKNEKLLHLCEPIKTYIQEELNTAEVILSNKVDQYYQQKINPNNKAMGKRLGQKLKAVPNIIKALTPEQIKEYQEKKTLVVGDIEFFEGDLEISQQFKCDHLENYQLFNGNEDFCIVLDVRQNEKLKNIGLIREFVNRIQRLRKEAGIVPTDDIIVFYKISEKAQNLVNAVNSEFQMIYSIVKKPILSAEKLSNNLVRIMSKNFKLDDGEEFEIVLTWNQVLFNEQNMKNKCGELAPEVEKVVIAYEHKQFQEIVQKQNGKFALELNEKLFELVLNEDFVFVTKQ